MSTFYCTNFHETGISTTTFVKKFCTEFPESLMNILVANIWSQMDMVSTQCVLCLLHRGCLKRDFHTCAKVTILFDYYLCRHQCKMYSFQFFLFPMFLAHLMLSCHCCFPTFISPHTNTHIKNNGQRCHKGVFIACILDLLECRIVIIIIIYKVWSVSLGQCNLHELEIVVL